MLSNTTHHILSILMEHLKRLKAHKNSKEEIYIFFTYHKDLKTMQLLEEMDNNEIYNMALGNEYEFKRLSFLQRGISVYLANDKGDFIENYLPYESIRGFTNGKVYLQCPNTEEVINIQDISGSGNMASLLHQQMLTIFKQLEKNGLMKNQVIKLTFLENFPNIQVPNHIRTGDKLLVLLLDEDSWNVKVTDQGLEFLIKNSASNAQVIYIPYGAIVTCVDNYSKILLNRNVKIIEDDFAELDYNMYEKDNLIYVDFDQILEEDDLSEISNLFANSFLSPQKDKMFEIKPMDNSDNLIIGEFDKDKKE